MNIRRSIWPFALALAACGLVHETAEQPGSQEVKVSGPTTLDLVTFNGGIEVVGGPEGAVLVTWTKRGSGETKKDAEADLANVEVKVTEEKGRVGVVARRTDTRIAWASGVSFVVTVPPRTPVRLRSSNGRLTVRGVGASVDAETSNGAVRVDEGAGKIDVKSSNGSLDVSGTDVSVRATTSNGAVAFFGSLAEGPNVLTSSNGSIDVGLPAAARFRISAHTSNGKVHLEQFAVQGVLKKDWRDLEGTVGESPTASLTLKTSNGGIRIHPAK